MDKFILTKSVPKPAVFVFYSTVFAMPLFLFVPFGVAFPAVAVDWLIFLISGVFFSIGLWAMYIGFQESEISHVGPLVGAATSFFVIFLSRFFLSEILTTIKIIAIFVLILGSLAISFEKSKEHNGWHKGMLWGVLSGLFFAISHVAAKYAYDKYGFYTGFIWTKSAIGLVGLAMLFLPSIRDSLKINKNHSADKKGFLPLVLADKVLGIAGVVLIQYAFAIGSVSLVNALAGVQYALLIILIALLSKFYPKLFRENYTGIEIFQEAASVIIIGIGLSIMVFS